MKGTKYWAVATRYMYFNRILKCYQELFCTANLLRHPCHQGRVLSQDCSSVVYTLYTWQVAMQDNKAQEALLQDDKLLVDDFCLCDV